MFIHTLFNLTPFEPLNTEIGIWRIKNFFTPNLLNFVEKKVLQHPFEQRDYLPMEGKPLFSELIQKKGHIIALDHMMHDPALIKFIAEQSNCPDLVKCDIRVYKFIPKADNKFGWHNDLDYGRTIGFSVNLTKEPFEGGVFHIRKIDQSISYNIQNLGYGDAIFFRIAPDLEHCVTTVTGSVERIACAGWFQV